MLAQSRQEHSGIQLEVNERILDSCTSLMMVSSLLHKQYNLFAKQTSGKIYEKYKGSSTV